MKNLSVILSLIWIAGSGLMGCAPAFKVDVQKMMNVRQVAIVGLTLEQEQANGITITFNGEDRGISAHRDKVVDPLRMSPLKEAERQRSIEPDPAAADIYAEVAMAFQKNYSWKTKSIEDMKSNAAYQDFRASPAMFSAFVPSAVPVHRFGVEGLGPALDSQSFPIETREELARSLGVDGFAFVKVRVSLNRADNFGIGRVSIGTYRPSAITTIEFYNLKDKDPIWIDRMASGEKAEGSVIQISGVTDYSQLRPTVVDAARKSLGVLMNRSRGRGV